MKIPYASRKCWREKQPPGAIWQGTLRVPCEPGQVPLAAFFPTSAGIDMPLRSGLCVLSTPALRRCDPAPLVEPGIALLPLEVPTPSPPPILYWDDRSGAMRAPDGELSCEYDPATEESDKDDDYDDLLEEPEYATKIGGFPCFPQAAEELIASCNECGELCIFIVQLAGNEAIDVGDGSLYLFMCPNGCEYRCKFQR